MSAPSPQNQSLLINKLTLMVLAGILVCLVVLVVRQRDFMAERDRQDQARASLDRSRAFEESAANAYNARTSGLFTPPRAAPVKSFPAVANIPSPVESPPAEFVQESAPPPVILPPTQVAFVSTIPASQSGEIAGTVWLRGTPPPEVPIQMDRDCARLQTNAPTTRHFVVTPDGRLANVFVYVKSGLPRTRFEPPPEAAMLDARNCFFEPYVQGVMTGQKIRFRNSDPFMDNIHAIPSPGSENREFDIGLPIQGGVAERSFPRPEIFVKIKCDVHPWMFAYIAVVEHPYFTVTDKEGNFQLPFRLPHGTYTLAAKHLKAGELTQKISVRQDAQQQVSFVFEVK